jgi:hypothetical protein
LKKEKIIFSGKDEQKRLEERRWYDDKVKNEEKDKYEVHWKEKCRNGKTWNGKKNVLKKKAGLS